MSDHIITTAEDSYPTNHSDHPSKVAVIGTGAVGSTLAYAYVAKGIAREIILQDIVKEKVEAEALDIAQRIQFTSADSISGSGDPEIYRDADVIVITADAKRKLDQSRLELADTAIGIMGKILFKLVRIAPSTILVLVTNPVDTATYCAKKITGLPENQVFDSGMVLDTVQVRYLISLETGTAVQNIHGYITGEHGDSEVPLWSFTEIGGVPVTRWDATLDGGVFDESKCECITHDVVRSTYRIIEGKGATNYAVSLAVQRVIGAVLSDEQRVLIISPLLDNWYGISDVCMAVPTIVGRKDVGHRLELPLTPEEKGRLTASADHLREVARGLDY